MWESEFWNTQHEIVCVCYCDDDFVRMFNIALANGQED